MVTKPEARHVRTDFLPRRRPVLGRDDAARSRGRGRVLQRGVRVEVREPHARWRRGPVLDRAVARPRGRRDRRPGRARYPDRVEHVHRRHQRGRDGEEGAGSGRNGAHRTGRRDGRRPLRNVRRSRRRDVLGLAGRTNDRRTARQRARHMELQRAEHARPSGRRRVLRRGVRMGNGILLDGRFRIRDLQAARLRRLPQAEQPRRRVERRSRHHTRRLHRRGDVDPTAHRRRTGALERHVRDRRARTQPHRAPRSTAGPSSCRRSTRSPCA